MIDHCSACKSTDITKGDLTIGPSFLKRHVFFKPEGLKVWTMTEHSGAPVDVYACRSCGFVWTATDPEALRTFMDKYCEKK